MAPSAAPASSRMPAVLDEQSPTRSELSGQHLEQPERIIDAMQDAEAEDEVEALLDVRHVECVHAPILDPGFEQRTDGVERLSASLKLDAPAVLDPVFVLLIVDGQHARRPAMLGKVAVEAVERAHIEHGHALEGVGDRVEAIAVIPRLARRV